MDPSYIETLVQRLVANPYDEEALTYAQQAGASDPRAYAMLLEKVGTTTPDAAHASHWLSEAANIWAVSLGDAHRAARILMVAIDKDPTQETAAERLGQLYREKGDARGLVALVERRIKALSPMVGQSPEIRARVAQLHEELGRTLGEPPMSQPDKALQHYQRALELDPRSAYSIYAAREIYKAQQQWADAIALFDMEHALVDDAERKVALYLDEASVRKQAGDLGGASQVLRNARSISPDGPELILELASMITDRVKSGEQVPSEERAEAAQLFVMLAEMYGGEHGLAYSLAALKAEPGNDRAIQLAGFFGKQLGQTEGLVGAWKAYLAINPNGAMSGEAKSELAALGIAPGGLPPAPPGRPSPGGSGGPGGPSGQAGSGRAPPGKPASKSSAFDELSRGDAPRTPATSAKSTPAPVEGTGLSKLETLEADADDDEDEVGETPAPAVAAPPAGAADKVAKLLQAAGDSALKGNKADAFAKYKEVLTLDPANSEAVPWVKDHLRQKRLYPELKDLLVAAARGSSSPDDKKALLRELAGLCEQQLRDVDGAIQAFKQLATLDRADASVGDSLRRLLERASKWDELASLLEEEAMSAPDVEEKISLEKKLAQLHEGKRKDLVAAGEAWSRIAGLTPNDDQPVLTAVALFEKAQRLDLAAQAISDNVAGLDDETSKGALLTRLAELHLKLDDLVAAGDAFAEAAEFTKSTKTWEAAEAAYVKAERWASAARAADARFDLVSDAKVQATLAAHAAELYEKAGDNATSIARLAQAVELDPSNEEGAKKLESTYEEDGRNVELSELLIRRAEHAKDKPLRVALRRRAALIQRDQLDNMDAARATLQKILEDGDDEETLLLLAEDAESREEYNEAVALLRRLGSSGGDDAKRAEARLREARLLDERLDDQEAAISRYESLLADVDPKHRGALRAIADLEERRDNPKNAAAALERELAVSEGADRIEVARRLVDLYTQLDDAKSTATALEVVVGAVDDDVASLDRLIDLREQLEEWPRVAELLTKRLENEGDVTEAGQLARRLATVLHEKLARGDEGMAALEGPADAGDERCREAYVTLGDSISRGGLVATKLLSWNESRGASPARTAALRGALTRFSSVDRDADAVKVALELVRSKSADAEVATQLEKSALKAKDIDALQTAHDIIAKDLSGAPRAEELIRQAEVLVQAGIEALEAMQHGEIGLASVPPDQAEALLKRLAALSPTSGLTIDLYERQVGRAKAPPDRLRALARAAQVAAEKGAIDRARGFFEIALAGGASEETLTSLEDAARDADGEGVEVRRTLAFALAAGGQGSRDGGRTRGALLRRAALIVHRVLNDLDQAFTWLGDATIAHVDASALDALEALGVEVGDMSRVEGVLTRALGEVFDGPLVRQLLARRASLRKDKLDNKVGAAQDLKKLHDLSPSDHAVMDELAGLLTELGDFRGMVQLLEDQILRSKDQTLRADIARKVATLWEERLGDSREAADAWRRVLRMKPGDADAQAGLERAKTNQLRKADGPATPAVSISATSLGAPSSSRPPPPVAKASAALPISPLSTPSTGPKSGAPPLPPKSSPAPKSGSAPPPPPSGFPKPPPPPMSRPSGMLQAVPAPPQSGSRIPIPSPSSGASKPPPPPPRSAPPLPPRSSGAPPLPGSSGSSGAPASSSPSSLSSLAKPTRPSVSFPGPHEEQTISAPGTSQAIARASVIADAPAISEMSPELSGATQENPIPPQIFDDEVTRVGAPVTSFHSEEEEISSVDDEELLDAGEVEDVEDEATPPHGTKK